MPGLVCAGFLPAGLPTSCLTTAPRFDTLKPVDIARKPLTEVNGVWTALAEIHTYIHQFNGSFSRTTWVSRYRKGKTNLDVTEARDSEWQWHQLGHMQVCTLLQTDNHASTQPLSFFYWPDALPAAQPTVSKHWRHIQQKCVQWYSSNSNWNSCYELISKTETQNILLIDKWLAKNLLKLEKKWFRKLEL